MGKANVVLSDTELEAELAEYTEQANKEIAEALSEPAEAIAYRVVGPKWFTIQYPPEQFSLMTDGGFEALARMMGYKLSGEATFSNGLRTLTFVPNPED